MLFIKDLVINMPQVTCRDVWYTFILLDGIVGILGSYPFMIAGSFRPRSHTFWALFLVFAVPIYTGAIYGLRWFGRLTHSRFEHFIGDPVNTVSVVMSLYSWLLVLTVALCHMCGVVIKLAWHERVTTIDLETFGLGLVWLMALASVVFVCVTVFWKR